MTIDVTLNNLANLSNQNTAVSVINNNNAAITSGFTSALNTSGDQMLGTLDMNSNQMLNLPSPGSADSPVRLQDIMNMQGATGLTVTVPTVGTSGSVVGYLNSNLTFSGNDTFTGTSQFTTVSASTLTVSALAASTFTVSTLTVGSNSTNNIRDTLTNNINLYVSTTGSDTNPGTSSLPFLTIQHAINYVVENIDQAGNSILINIGPGTFTGFNSTAGAWLGNSQISISGAGSVTTFIQCQSNGYAAFIKDYAAHTLSALTLEDNGSSNGAGGLYVNQMGVCDIAQDVKFGTIANGAHLIAINGGVSNIIFPYTISGNAVTHLEVSNGGLVVYNSGSGVAIPSSRSFSTFCYCAYQGKVVTTGASTFTGSGFSGCSGLKFTITAGGCVTTQGFDLNTVFPGNVNGSYALTLPIDFAGTATLSNTQISLINYTATTLSALTSMVAGTKGIVTDANSTTFYATITGGASSVVPVFYTGSAWRIG